MNNLFWRGDDNVGDTVICEEHVCKSNLDVDENELVWAVAVDDDSPLPIPLDRFFIRLLVVVEVLLVVEATKMKASKRFESNGVVERKRDWLVLI